MADRSNGNDESHQDHRFRAYPDLDPSLEVVIRFQEVKRWHMIDVAPTQNLASHSATVALLAGYIAHTCPGMYFGSSAEMMIQGLIHDIGETMTGDIPGHVKHVLGEGPKKLEHQLTPRWLRGTEDSNTRHLIKLCDLAEAIRYVKIHGITRAASWAANQLRIVYEKHIGLVTEDWPDLVVIHVVKNLNDYMDTR